MVGVAEGEHCGGPPGVEGRAQEKGCGFRNDSSFPGSLKGS